MIAQLLLFLMIAIFPICVHATNFKCDLELGLIDNSISTESKQLSFESEIQINGTGNTTGTLISNSCFGKTFEPWNSSHSQFQAEIIGDRIEGTFTDSTLSIGNYHYQLALHFTQIKKDPSNPQEIHFMAKGKLIPLDQADFIHQNAAGECHLSH